MNSKELHSLAASEADLAQNILNKATEEKRILTADETAEIEKHLANTEVAKAQAELAKRVETAKSMADAVLPVDLDEAPAVITGLPKPAAQPRDRGLEARHGFDNLGQFAQSVFGAMSPGNRQVDNRLNFFAAASGMEQAYGPSGGYLVPPAFSTKIWEGLSGSSQSLMGYCDTYTVEGESLTLVANAETSRVDGSRWGGVRGYWKSEVAQMTDTNPTFRQLKIEPQELYVFSYVTDKLLRNASALEQYLTRACTDEIAFKVGNSIINGTGSGQPLGVLNASCTVSVAKETSQVATSILTANLLKMRARLHPSSWAKAVWFINQDTIPQLAQLFIAVKNVAGSENVGGFNTQIFDPSAMTLFGKTVVPIEYCPTLGTVGDVILADLSGYALGTKGGINSAMSIHLRFDYNETCFRWIFEVDGQPYLQSALTPFKGTATLSTFVTVATRS